MGFTRIAHGRFRANALPWTCGEDAQSEREWNHETPGCSGFGPVQKQVQFFGVCSSTELPPYLEDLMKPIQRQSGKCRRVDLWSNYSQTNQHTPNPWRLGRWFFFFRCWSFVGWTFFFPDFSCHYIFLPFLWWFKFPFHPSSHIPGAYGDANTHRTYRRTEGVDLVGALCLEGGVEHWKFEIELKIFWKVVDFPASTSWTTFTWSIARMSWRVSQKRPNLELRSNNGIHRNLSFFDLALSARV